MLDWGKRFSNLQGGKGGGGVCVWKNVHKYGSKAKDSNAGVVLGRLSSPSEEWIWVHIKVFSFIIMNINACVVPSSRISELKGFSLNLAWITRWLAHSHDAWQVSGEGWSEGIVRSREWSVVVASPLWQPKGHHQGWDGSRDLTAIRSSVILVLLSRFKV